MPPEPRPEIQQMTPYAIADTSAASTGRVIQLAQNESALDPSPNAVAAYNDAASRLARYSDPDHTDLRAAIAARHGLDPARLVCGAGSTELLLLLALAYLGRGHELLRSRHHYKYADAAAAMMGAKVVTAPEQDLTADVDALLAAVSPATRLLVLANPNNPTGSLLPAPALVRLRQGLDGEVLLVLDAAYAEFVDDPAYEAGTSLVEASNNVVMLRTFSKIYGLAGLRVGWAYGPPAVVEVLNRIRPANSVSAAAQAAATAAVADQDHVVRSREEVADLRERFRAEAAALGLTAYPSHGNFVLLRFTEPAAAAVDQALRQRGIVVRRQGAYELSDCLRVTIGSAEEMALLTRALGDILAS